MNNTVVSSVYSIKEKEDIAVLLMDWHVIKVDILRSIIFLVPHETQHLFYQALRHSPLYNNTMSKIPFYCILYCV